MASSSSSSAVRSWRMAFLTLRDEILISPPPTASLPLLHDLILSHFDTLIAAAPQLPPNEVTLDLMLLLELALAIPESEEAADASLLICHLIHDVCYSVHLEIHTSSWTLMMNFLEKIVEKSLGFADNKILYLHTGSRIKLITEILEIIRLTLKAYGMSGSDSESTQLIRLLLSIVSCLHADLLSSFQPSDTHCPATDCISLSFKSSSIWELETNAFSMIKDALSSLGSSISFNLWQSAVEVLRKMMDFLASKNFILENNTMARFFPTLLGCLHSLLSDPKGSISVHAAGFIATLQMFFMYGRSSVANTSSKDRIIGSQNMKPKVINQSGSGPYRPPHVRRKGGNRIHLSDAQSSSDSERSKYVLSSSDSDHSDSDGYAKDGDYYQHSKARLAAILCIQDICLADPKSLSSVWTLLLPENDVLHPRKHQATLMTCLLFDPVLKIRITSASALASILDGNSSVFLQVAEHKEPAKFGPFTTLSSSLGQILVQLHTGILYLIEHETHSGLTASSLKVLMLLISATPYTRMPGELLPTTVASVHARILSDLAFKVKNMGLLVTAISCLGAAFSRSPPSLSVLKMLQNAGKGGSDEKEHSSIPFLLLQLSEQGNHPVVGNEALQALRAISHNYPNISSTFWEQISNTAYGLLQLPGSEDSSCNSSSGMWIGAPDRNLEVPFERHIMAAVKALDGCLRAASGFKGADSLLECRLRDIKLNSDCTKVLKISSAPSYALGGPEATEGCHPGFPFGSKQWREVIGKHLPLALKHSSYVVRAASVTCFAGMTSSVFFSLPKEKQDFIISSAVIAAVNDDSSYVRSAACRAIGVISCFSDIFSSAGVLNELIRATEFNTHDPVASVRITASWALANICDSLRHIETELQLGALEGELHDSGSIALLLETALRLTKDGDKIKSNAVRALGNLSRFIRFTYSFAGTNASGDSLYFSDSSQSIGFSLDSISKSNLCGDPHWPERMVQAFISCVTTGNVKVQWNVCHAMSNLFMNDTLRLQHMPWASGVYSILLLLLRDSTNYKIRINAAVALSVPSSRADYGNSFPDVVQGLEHVCEFMGSDHASDPSSYKYKDNLEKQLALTTLHVLGFASSKDDQTLKDFFIKKASFLEEWFKMLCSSCIEPDHHCSASEATVTENREHATGFAPQKEMLLRAMKNLIDVFMSSNQQAIAQRFEALVKTLS